MVKKVEKIEDLEKIYYGPNKDGKNVDLTGVISYEDSIRTDFITPMRENEVKRIFSPIGKVEKIPKNNQKKTSDFKIENEKLIIEVKSINTAIVGEQDEYGNVPLNLPPDEDKFVERINTQISKAEEKEDTLGYCKIVAIYYDLEILASLASKRRLITKLFDSTFIRKTIYPSSSFDALVFLPPKVAWNRETPGPICYVKEQRMAGLLDKIQDLEVRLLEDKSKVDQ